jgi:hypothetical protein
VQAPAITARRRPPRPASPTVLVDQILGEDSNIGSLPFTNPKGEAYGIKWSRAVGAGDLGTALQ